MLFSILTIFALTFAVACGDDDDDDDDGDPTATSPADEDKMGGEITVHYVEFDSFDPHFSSFSQSIGHQGMVFRGLYKLDTENAPVPEMAAEAPAISSDGLTYTVKLQDGLTWSDGDDLLAEDFVLGMQRTCHFAIGGQYQYVLSNVVGCDELYDAEANEGKSEAEIAALTEAVGARAVDDTTVEFTLEAPQPTFTILLSMWPTWPVPAHIVPGAGDEWPTDPTTLAFNGPFVVDSYTPGVEMVFARNDNYAGGHLAYLDRVTFRYIEDTAQANNAYRSGELQMAVADTSNLTGLQSEFPDNLLSQPSASTIGLEMNMDNEFLADPLVREAFSRSIDRETMASVVLQGAHIPTTSWVPPDIIGQGVTTDSFADQIGYDPERAAAALEEAGYPNGEGLPVFSYVLRDTPSGIAISEFLQAEWEALGIEIDIQIVDAPTRSQRFTNEDFDLFPGGWIQDYPDPENWIIGLYDTDGGLNHYNCSDPEIDALIEQAQFNTNNEERLSQYAEINELISAGLCGIAVWYHQGNHYLIADELGGAREFSTSQNRVLAGDWAAEEWFLQD
jgi:ABC-type oligopeptide transport system substrate-binding subunit